MIPGHIRYFILFYIAITQYDPWTYPLFYLIFKKFMLIRARECLTGCQKIYLEKLNNFQ